MSTEKTELHIYPLKHVLGVRFSQQQKAKCAGSNMKPERADFNQSPLLRYKIIPDALLLVLLVTNFIHPPYYTRVKSN